MREDFAHIVVRQSVTKGQATISVEQQEAYCRDYVTNVLRLMVHGVSVDRSTSAFKIPPLERKHLREGLDQCAEYGTLIYYQSSRLCRRVDDFMDMRKWAKANDVRLRSVTETGDPLTHEGLLSTFVIAWKDEADSQGKSEKMISVHRDLHADGRWTGGRPAYGLRAVCRCHELETCPDLKHCTGWELRIHDGRQKILAEAARRVAAGKSVNAVISDMNAAEILSTDGKPWSSHALRKILRSPKAIDVIGPALWAEVQAVIGKPAAGNHGTRTATDNPLLDLVWCGRCLDAGRAKGKVYRWHRASQDRFYGRCRNELKRAEQHEACDMPMIPFTLLEQAAEADLLDEHGGDLIEIKITDDAGAAAQIRMEQINGELVSLAADRAAGRITRAEHRERSADLEDELDALEQPGSDEREDSAWRATGETVRQNWGRLSPAERRLWLIRIGTTWTVYRDTRAAGAARWRVQSSWQPADDPARRERVVRA
jgi:DNA invertase Pin-like site-specific DNA recombinase